MPSKVLNIYCSIDKIINNENTEFKLMFFSLLKEKKWKKDEGRGSK